MKLLTLVMWKCVYDRIVYLNIVKKVSIFFQKKGFFKGGAQMLSYAPGWFGNEIRRMWFGCRNYMVDFPPLVGIT